MSDKTGSDAGVLRTLQDQIEREVEFDVELWHDLARKDIDLLDEEDQQTVEEAVATILWYLGMATCTTASEPCEEDYRRLRECCGQANYYRNVIRETFLKARGVECDEWAMDRDQDEDERPADGVLH